MCRPNSSQHQPVAELSWCIGVVPIALVCLLLAIATAPLAAVQGAASGGLENQTQGPALPTLPTGWQGNAGLVVSVVDEQGAPLPDAEVALSREEGAERLVTRTDDTGRVSLQGLAAGEWQIDIRREGFMLFNAYVLLQEGKKPKVAFSSRQRTGSYWAPLQAVFLPIGVQLTPGVASGRESVRRAQGRADRVAKDARRDERRAARSAERGRLARVVPSEPVESTVKGLVDAPTAVSSTQDDQPSSQDDIEVASEAVAADAPAPPALEAPRGSDTRQEEDSRVASEAGPEASPEVEPEAESRATSEARAELGRTLLPQVEAVQGPAASDPPEPTPSSESGAGARASSSEGAVSATPAVPLAVEYAVLSPTPRVLRNPNLLPAGTCPECGPGEFSVASRGQAEKFVRGSTCAAVGVDLMKELVPRINGALVEKLSTFAGSLAESNGNDVLRLLPATLRTDIRQALASQAKSCQVLGVVLPAGARYVGFRYQAGERSLMAECPAGEPGGVQDCQVGDASWLSPPTIVKSEGVTLILGLFENRSRRSTRLPRLVVYFQPPRGWLPPS